MKRYKAIPLIIFLLISTLVVSQNEEKEVKEYYENGQLKSICKTIDGKLNGEWKSYHENGQLFESAYLIDGLQTGEYKNYYNTGKLYMIGNFIDGIQTGEWKSYFENGNHTSKMDNYHKLDLIVMDYNMENGPTILKVVKKR